MPLPCSQHGQSVDPRSPARVSDEFLACPPNARDVITCICFADRRNEKTGPMIGFHMTRVNVCPCQMNDTQSEKGVVSCSGQDEPSFNTSHNQQCVVEQHVSSGDGVNRHRHTDPAPTEASEHNVCVCSSCFAVSEARRSPGFIVKLCVRGKVQAGFTLGASCMSVNYRCHWRCVCRPCALRPCTGE